MSCQERRGAGRSSSVVQVNSKNTSTARPGGRGREKKTRHSRRGGGPRGLYTTRTARQFREVDDATIGIEAPMEGPKEGSKDSEEGYSNGILKGLEAGPAGGLATESTYIKDEVTLISGCIQGFLARAKLTPLIPTNSTNGMTGQIAWEAGEVPLRPAMPSG